MNLTLITPPAALPLGYEETIEFLRIEDGTADGQTIATLIAAATQDVSDFLGRQLVTATWKMTLPAFPATWHFGFPRFHSGRRFHATIEIPLPPTQEIVSLTYVDTTGATQTLAAGTDFEVAGLNSTGQAEVWPIAGFWPATRRQPDAVQIEFVAGYQPTSSPVDLAENVPPLIRNAILETVSTRFTLRERAAFGTRLGYAVLADNVMESLSSFRVWQF